MSNFQISQAQTPRTPTEPEVAELAKWLMTHFEIEHDEAVGVTRSAFVAVYDNYMTGGPGYWGKLMSVVWDGAPSVFDVFTWHSGALVREGREYDSHECYRCGGKDGTLCWTCWRSEKR